MEETDPASAAAPEARPRLRRLVLFPFVLTRPIFRVLDLLLIALGFLVVVGAIAGARSLGPGSEVAIPLVLAGSLLVAGSTGGLFTAYDPQLRDRSLAWIGILAPLTQAAGGFLVLALAEGVIGWCADLWGGAICDPLLTAVSLASPHASWLALVGFALTVRLGLGVARAALLWIEAAATSTRPASGRAPHRPGGSKIG